jgi:type VI secretion system secreted protein Hcp
MSVAKNVDIFMKLDSIKGESKDEKHRGEIDVFAYHLKVDQEGTRHVGSGGGAGKATFQDLTITCQVDTSTTDLFQCCASGKHIANGVLTLRKAGDKPLEFFVATLIDIIVSSVEFHAPNSDEPRHLVDVKLNYAKVKLKYYPQSDSGAAGVPTEGGWDIAANKPEK